MLFLFSHRKKQKAIAASAAQDRMAANIVHHCIRWQSKWAAWMQHKAERLSNKGKTIVLLLFCLPAGSYNIYHTLSSFSGKQLPPLTIFKQPKYTHPSGGEFSHAPAVIAEEEYREIQRFRQYMDSLDQTPPGEKLLDSLMANRPGLIDSVLLFENLYQSQIKK